MEVFFYFFHFLFFWHDATRGTSFSASFAGLATILPHFILGLAYSGWRPCERRCVICVGIDGRSSSSGSHLFYIIYMLFYNLELLHHHTVSTSSGLHVVPCTGPRPGVSCTFANLTGPSLIATGRLRTGFSIRVPSWHTVST